MSDPRDDTVEFHPKPDFADSFFASAAEARLPVSFGAASHVGNVRTQNEDHYAVFQLQRSVDLVCSSLTSEELPPHEMSSYGMVVADGMGGMNSGELASRRALQTMVELTGQATSWVMKLTDLDAQQVQNRVDAYVQRIHASLQREGKSDPAKENMGTTWTSAHLLGQVALVVHIGDSRAYHFRNGVLRQVTHDETMAQSLVDSGVEPSSVQKFRHILLNCFGGDNDNASASIYELQLAPEDQLLLCTDGLTDMVSDEDIVAELQRHTNPQAACDALVQRALNNGGKDNVTVIVATLESPPSS